MKYFKFKVRYIKRTLSLIFMIIIPLSIQISKSNAIDFIQATFQMEICLQLPLDLSLARKLSYKFDSLEIKYYQLIFT